MRRTFTIASISLLLASSGCRQIVGEPPVFDFPSVVRVRAGGDVPLPGVVVRLGSHTAAITDVHGEAHLVMRGHDGDRREVRVQCPAEYQSPAHPLVVPLRRVTGAVTAPRYEVACPSLKRTIVIAARLENGANLPIVYLGQSIARADGDGAAHVLVRVPKGEPFRLGIDTSSDPDLLPQDPVFDFAGGDEDDLLLVDQRFARAPKAVRHHSRRRVSQRPTRL